MNSDGIPRALKYRQISIRARHLNMSLVENSIRDADTIRMHP